MVFYCPEICVYSMLLHGKANLSNISEQNEMVNFSAEIIPDLEEKAVKVSRKHNLSCT